jgi:hypothetical protein
MGALLDGVQQVGEAGWIGIPVPTTFIVEPSDGHHRSGGMRRRWSRNTGDPEREQRSGTSNHGNPITRR